MDGVDGGLQLVGAGLIAAQARADDRLSLRDQRPVPACAVLLAEQHERAVEGGSRRAARLGQQHQRQQAGDFRLVGHQGRQQPRQPDRLGAQLRVLRAGVVDQVDDREHRREAGGKLVIVRHAVRDPGRLDLALGTHEPLSHRRLGHQERASDLLGRETAEQPQRERHLSLRSERRVTAREDETQPVVLHGSSLLRRARVVVGRERCPSASSSRPRDSRRRRSMARLRAVVVIQPPGLGGSPSRAQRRRAIAYASCTASSAMSISPKTRISVATERPDASRKTRPIAASPGAGVTPRRCA